MAHKIISMLERLPAASPSPVEWFDATRRKAANRWLADGLLSRYVLNAPMPIGINGALQRSRGLLPAPAILEELWLSPDAGDSSQAEVFGVHGEGAVSFASQEHLIYDDTPQRRLPSGAVKVMYVINRAVGLSSLECQRVWRAEHAELVIRNVPRSRMRRYTQSHAVIGARTDDRCPDGVTAAWCDSLADFRGVDLAARDAARELLADELRFIDSTRSSLFLVDEVVRLQS